jgi:hypothetical protein
MRMLSSTMIKLLNVNEQPQKFFASEEERLKEIKQEFPDNELLEGITATSFLDYQFVSSQEKNHITSSDSISPYTVVDISTNILEKFKSWFLEKLLELLPGIFNTQVTKDNLYDDDYLIRLALENPENDYVVSWWQEEGRVFIEQIYTLSIPHTLAGLHDEILLCDFFVKSTAFDSELEKLFSIAELFIWEWKLLEERHPTVERFNSRDILMKQWIEMLSSHSFELPIDCNLIAKQEIACETCSSYINEDVSDYGTSCSRNLGIKEKQAFQDSWEISISSTGGIDVGDRTSDPFMSAA